MEAIANVRVARMLTHADHAGLSRLLREDAAVLPQKREVQASLASCLLLPPALVPATLVTIDARVRLQNHGSEAPYDIALCYPAQADASLARVSVLSPLGASLLGLSVGDTVSWHAFGSVHKAPVLAIPGSGARAWRAGRRSRAATARGGPGDPDSP